MQKAEEFEPWAIAWRRAVFDPPSGWAYNSNSPRDHFATPADCPALPRILASLLVEILADGGLRRGGDLVDLVDIGAGDGHLLTSTLQALPKSVQAHVRARAFDVRDPPPRLPANIEWEVGDVTCGLPMFDGLVLANEFLDDIPCNLAERSGDRPDDWREVLVDGSGREVVGGKPASPDLDWLNAWARAAPSGSRVEIGLPRDRAARTLAASLRTGLLVIIDYGFDAELRSRRHPHGTLTGYRSGRQTAAIPDGRRNLTAHVAFDSVAAALASLGKLTVTSLGAVAASRRPNVPGQVGVPALLTEAPWAQLQDPASWGSFTWLQLTRP